MIVNDRARARISVNYSYVSRQQTYVGACEHLSTETSVIEILIVLLAGSVQRVCGECWDGAAIIDKETDMHS